MLVYHTSDQRFETPDVVHSRDALDFGKGFYVTRLKEQAVSYADRFRISIADTQSQMKSGIKLLHRGVWAVYAEKI